VGKYLDLSEQIAADVVSGALVPGAALPSIRDAARRQGTSVSTVSRAYRRLAEAGVIVPGDRRRARVAHGGLRAARLLLGSPAALRLAGSDDPALDLALARASGSVTTSGARGSLHGLTALWRGTADAAVIHLRHVSGGYNAPFARTLLRGRRPALVHLWRREQGLLVPPGNPRGVRGTASLRGLRLARRRPGAGTRVLLDRLLADAGLPADAAPGPQVGSHLEVALCVASGAADAGLGVRAAATALGLHFVPLLWEEYDLVLAESALARAEPLLEAVTDQAVRAAQAQLGGYDLAGTGTVRLLE